MEKTATEIYGPVLSLIRRMQDASDSEMSTIKLELSKLAEQTLTELQAFDNNFQAIKNNNSELETKIRDLHELLDRKKEQVSELDYLNSMANCEEIYKSFWDKLDSNSKDYLTMANYLYKIFSNNDNDCAPSVLEFGRALENELIVKIYDGYIIELSSNTKPMIDHGRLYGDLKGAIRSYKNNKGTYYIPAKLMVKYLKHLSDKNIHNDYNDALKKYLQKKCIEQTIISEKKFIDIAEEIFDKYRNNAAHAGLSINLDDASSCREKTKKVLRTFMKAINQS